MKLISSILYLILVAGVAQASPYIVYSGTATGTSASSAGSTKTSTTLYLLTDLADTSNFAILQLDVKDGVYTVISRPSDSPPADEATDNFFSGIVEANGRSGTGVLSYTTSTTDSNGNTNIARAYATGALTLNPTQLVAARNRPLVVTLKTNGTVTGTYTFNTSAAISSGGNAFPKSLSGTFSNYEIGASGQLAYVSSGGAFSLSENATLTDFANIGGYSVGRNTAAMMPVTIPDGTSEADALAAWLSAFAQANGYSLPTTNSPASVTNGASLADGIEISDGALTYSGGLSLTTQNTSTVKLGVGTYVLDGANASSSNLDVLFTASSLASLTSTNSLLVIGGTTPPPVTDRTIGVVQNYSNIPGATLTVNISGLLGGGEIVSGTGGTLSLNSSPILIDGLVSPTLAITAVNSDSTVNGTINFPIGADTITFSNVTLVNSSATSVTVPPFAAGQVIQCNISATGSVFSGSAPSETMTGGTITISNVTSDTDSSSTSTGQ